MINLLSYGGMNLQSEVCLWTLLGLIRTIFDATLFKVNANLKQVWQMSMPEELSMSLQRALRTMISGVMLVQCFTVYVYLASYIVLLYPVFLEERPTLVLPWLLLAAVRKLLCELMSLALGLGTCVLLGPARPPCIKFVIIKVISIMPAFYTWMLVFSYYHALKVATTYKTFPVLPPSDHDYGLELAVRRRRTKSLQGEEQLRTKLVASFYGDRHLSTTEETSVNHQNSRQISLMTHSTDTSVENITGKFEYFQLSSTTSNRLTSDAGSYEDWFGNEVTIPRDTDRILEQFVLMLLRIGAYYKKEGINSVKLFRTNSPMVLPKLNSLDCTTLPAVDTETPPLVGSSKENTASYLRQYPQIFMKKPEIPLQLHSDHKLRTDRAAHRQIESNDDVDTIKSQERSVSVASKETLSLEIDKFVNPKKSDISEKKRLQRNLNTKSVSVKKQKLRYDSKTKDSNEKDRKIKCDLKLDKKRKEDMKSSSVDSLNSIIEKMKSRVLKERLDINDNTVEEISSNHKHQSDVKPTSIDKENNELSVSSSINLQSVETSNKTRIASTTTNKKNDKK